MKKARRFHVAFVCLALIVVLLSACAGSPAAPDCTKIEVFCVGLVTELGKIDDQALNQMAWEGAKKAELKLGAHVQYIETVDSRDYDRNIAIFADAGYDLIITVGYAQNKVSIAAARKYPHIAFIGVDQPLEPDKALPQNLTGLSFAEDQLGFLAGALAARMTKAGKIGAVCGPDNFPPAWRYCEGFKAGANYIISPPEPTPTPTIAPPTIEAAPTEEPTMEELPTDEFPTDEFPTDEFPTDEPQVDEPTEEEFPTDEPEPTDEEFPTDEPTEQEISFKAPAAQDTATPPGPPLEGPTATTFPLAPGQTPTPSATPVAVSVVYHNEVGYKDSLADPKWDATAAVTLMSSGVDVIFGADSYGENGAVSAAAKNGRYAIGVNTDQYYTLPEAQDRLLSSAIKEVTTGVFDLIKAAQGGYFPGGDFLGAAGYAPFHNFSSRIPPAVRVRLAELQQALAEGKIDTGVSPEKP